MDAWTLLDRYRHIRLSCIRRTLHRQKITGDLAEQHYRAVDTSTGEIIQRTPEFIGMSLKPAIGAEWYERFRDDVFPATKSPYPDASSKSLATTTQNSKRRIRTLYENLRLHDAVALLEGRLTTLLRAWLRARK